MAEVVLLTRVLPGGGGAAGGVASAPPPPQRPLPKLGELWGEPLALGVSQVLLGFSQVSLGVSLLVALGDPVGAQLGAPLGGGAALVISGSMLAAMAKNPSAGRARAALALTITAAILSFLSLGLQALLLPHSCPWCFHLSPAAQGALLGTQVLLMTSSAAGAVLAVIGCVAASRARPRAGPTPVVIYQTALPAPGAGPAEATPTEQQ